MTRARSHERDRAALAKTRFALLPQWSDAWGGPLSSWDGVQVNEEGRVAKLDLHGKQVKCVFPREICELDALKELVLHTNRLSGSLPAELGELSALEKLDVWDNFLEGTIPKALAKLSALTELHLSGNFLSGPIPRELGSLSNLRALYLHGNKLSGEIPRALGDLRRLQKLVLINNRLTGPIPAELGKLKVIVEINLANNRLSGSIPAELGQLSNLTKLYLWGNNLSGSIPEELGELALLEKLDLAQNALLMGGGGIPLALRNHRNFRRFIFAVPENGAPIPPWRSKRSLLPALVLGYLDLLTDLATVLSYWRSGLTPWFAAGLAFIVGPALFAGGFVARKESSPWRGAAAAAQLGLLVEGAVSAKEETYSHSLVAIRVLESLFQSLPQLLLQAYVLLVEQDFLALRALSVAASTLSLATTSTGIVAEHPLSQLRWARGVDYPTAKLPGASSLLFGTVPYVGSVYVRMGFRIHPQDFVWWFLAYQCMEIVSRVLSLAVVAAPLGYYTFVLLAWVWLSRSYIARVSVGGAPVVRERLLFRKLIRFAAAPIMDSVIDRVKAYKVCCFMTCVETVCFLVVGNVVVTPDAEESLDFDLARRIFSVVSILFMGGKIALATAIVVPFKAKIGECVPPVKGELRVEEEDGNNNNNNKSSTKGGGGASIPNRKDPGGSGDGSAFGPATTDQHGAATTTVSMDAVMAAVVVMDPAAAKDGALLEKVKTTADDGRFDHGGDVENGLGGGGGGIRYDDVGTLGGGDNSGPPGRGRGRRVSEGGGSSSSSSSRRAGRESFTSAAGGGGTSSRAALQTVEEGRERGQESCADGSSGGGGVSGRTASPGCKDREEDDDGEGEEQEEDDDGEEGISFSSASSSSSSSHGDEKKAQDLVAPSHG